MFLFGFMLKVPVNSYGHDGTVSSPNLTFFLGNILSLVTDNNPSEGKRMAAEIKLNLIIESSQDTIKSN